MYVVIYSYVLSRKDTYFSPFYFSLWTVDAVDSIGE